MAEEHATPEQKLSIAKYFILSAPIGEVNEVVKDVKNLINDSVVLNHDNLHSIMHEYNTKNLVYAMAPHGEEVIVSKFGQIDASGHTYLDPATGKVLKFDHISQTFTGETDQKQVLSAEIDATRRAVETNLKAYVEGNYRPKKCVFAVYGADDGSITVCISAKNTRLSSYWTGGINGVYRILVNKHGSSELKADLRFNVHYFEDGNVQLHTEFNKVVKVDIGHDAAANGRAIVAAIEKIESDYHANLEDMYVSMHSQTFKAMRRFLPVSGQPMRWDSSVHGLASEIAQ